MPRLPRTVASEGRGLLPVLLVRLHAMPTDSSEQQGLLFATPHRTDRRTRRLGVTTATQPPPAPARLADAAGVFGAILAALCCAGTPLIVGALTAMGLSALRQDAILWPIMLVSLAVAVGVLAGPARAPRASAVDSWSRRRGVSCAWRHRAARPARHADDLWWRDPACGSYRLEHRRPAPLREGCIGKVSRPSAA